MVTASRYSLVRRHKACWGQTAQTHTILLTQKHEVLVAKVFTRPLALDGINTPLKGTSRVPQQIQEDRYLGTEGHK